VAAVPALMAAATRRRVASLLIVFSVPSTLVLAGVPVGVLMPSVWPRAADQLAAGLARAMTPGSAPVPSAWPLAAVMLASGTFWAAGTALPGAGLLRGRRANVGLALLVAPWLAAISRTIPDHAASQGALALIGGVLWFPRPRQAITVGVAAALLAVPLAHAIGPRSRWFGVGGAAMSEQQFRTLDTQPTYGPLTDRRTGAPMLEVAAPDPALWRMQTLDEFDGRGWTLGSRAAPELPQPAARPETVSVRVLGLSDDLVVAPGQIERVISRATVTRAAGDAWRLAPAPRTGATYRVRAAYVDVGSRLLAEDRAPLDPRARAYTQLWSVKLSPELQALSLMLAPFGVTVGALRRSAPTVDPRVIALARRLAAGGRTEWDVVARVERYLLDGGRFRYTTRVPSPGPQPLNDFLLRTHAGYCQQFAGAAALLLRLAGVPVRVAVGFATGIESARGRYIVRDLDAHEWIEVYFQGYGWVPFNPTPSTAPAAVASGLDPLRPGAPATEGLTGPSLPAVLAILATLFVAIVGGSCFGRDRRTTLSLEAIASRLGASVVPSTTLSELRTILARVGPRTAGLAAELERARFTADAPVTVRVARLRLALALVSDVGVLRTVLFWAPARRPSRNSGNRSRGQVGATGPEETLGRASLEANRRGARTSDARCRDT